MKKEQALAKKTFDLSEMGEIPALSCMPWQFFFEDEDIVADIPEEGWKIAFELKRQNTKHALDLEPTWDSQLSESNVST